MQQTEVALVPSSSPEQNWYRGALRKFARLDAAWLTVFICYCAVFGGILIYSDFLPYTFDNNESFSAFWHARNMYEYGIANSSGLPNQLLLVFAALLLAYVLVFFVFTGYVFTGYFARYLSLTVYLNDLLLALGLVAMIDCASGWYAAFKHSIGSSRIARGSGAAAAMIGLGVSSFIGVAWRFSF